MGLWNQFRMKKMLKIRSVALFLCLFSFVMIFSYVKEYSKNNVMIPKLPRILKMSFRLSNRKFEYLNNSVMYKNKKCFHLKWNYTSTSLTNLRTPQCKRFITIAKSKGRTGNDLFQIATILGLAYRYDLIPVIPSSFPLHKFLNLPNTVDFNKERLTNKVNLFANEVAIYRDFSERLSSEFHNFTMGGSFQSWRYFDTDTERDIIRNALRLKSDHFDNAKRYMKKVNPEGYKQVCIHIRRGDFSDPKRLKRGYAVVDEKFVEKAKHILRQNATNVVYLVVTNDKQWCLENLKNVNISPFDNPGDDLALMALSDHAVVSAGSFGWWGAWLAGGNVVYYKEFPRSKSYIATLFNKTDYYPPDWIGIV